MLTCLVEQYGDGYLCIIPFFLLPGSDYSRLLQPLPAAFSSQPQFKMQLPLFSCSPQRTRADFIHPSLCQPSGKTSPALICLQEKKDNSSSTCSLKIKKAAPGPLSHTFQRPASAHPSAAADTQPLSTSSSLHLQPRTATVCTKQCASQ